MKPKTTFGWKEGSGLGAWEVAARYSSLDLNDGGVRGGVQNAVTLGLNWDLYPNTRNMWNYVYNDVDHDVAVAVGAAGGTFGGVDDRRVLEEALLERGQLLGDGLEGDFVRLPGVVVADGAILHEVDARHGYQTCWRHGIGWSCL